MDKILQKIDKTNNCWNWNGYINEKGYGEVNFKGKKYRTHRLLYEIYKGKIQQGLEIDHLCRNRKCVNPDHLEAVDHLENIRRAKPFLKKKTHCKQGHRFTKENTVILIRKNGKTNRVCRICKSIIMKKYRSNPAHLKD